jgi:hypothetical protein
VKVTSKNQRLFVALTCKWLVWVHKNGYELTEGDGYRDPRVFGNFGERKGYGESQSYHKLRLAHDWNLFINGRYQTATEAHRPLGEYWESLHPRNRWGGRYNDGNHYEHLPYDWRK